VKALARKTPLSGASAWPFFQWTKPADAGLGVSLIEELWISLVLVNSDRGLTLEAIVTQNVSVNLQHGRDRRFRTSLDCVDTTKPNEIIDLDA
jgi:hypothetical protein